MRPLLHYVPTCLYVSNFCQCCIGFFCVFTSFLFDYDLHVVSIMVFHKSCDVFCSERVYSSSRNIPPSFTVRRTFTVRNTGPLPIYIDKMMIGSVECDGYGFKIIDCTSFDLLPNESHKVDIMLVSVVMLCD